MLEALLPAPRLIEIDHVDVTAPPEQVYQAIRDFDAARSPLIRALFTLRTLPERLSHGETAQAPSLRLAELGRDPAPGFRVLADRPGVGIAVGAVGKFWEAEIPFVDCRPEEFAAFDAPGWGKVAWAIVLTPFGQGTRIVFELRVTATSEDAWTEQRRYLRLIGPFSHLIRRHLLGMLARELGTPEAEEQTRPLPGDERIPHPLGQSTHGITIDAPPERIWPWLLQLGCRRGGWYCYDWLHNGRRPSAHRIDPELQRLAVGQILPATPDGEEGFTVLELHPGRALVLGGTFDQEARRSVPEDAPLPERYWRATWAFALEPLDPAHTRLHVRARVDYAPASLRWRAAWMRPVHAFMQMEQLRNLKRRAEGLVPDDDDLDDRTDEDRGSWRDVGEGMVAALGMVANLMTPFLRHRRSRWGLDEAAAARDYPGDALVPDPAWSWTHGVEIDAPAAEVWPWVAQIGQDKAGFYSYQWLENLAGCRIHNADRIHPEWQGLQEGDGLRLHHAMEPLPIIALEPGRLFVAAAEIRQSGAAPAASPAPDDRPGAVSWLFLLEPLGAARCRLISRYRMRTGTGLAARLSFGPLLLEPIGFMMDRRMLLGIKERAERAGRAAQDAAEAA